MLWGEYLARGVVAVPDLSHSLTPPDESRVEKVLKYVEELFRQDGASSFSSKMAIGFLQVKLASVPEKMVRVVAYLLSRLNGKPTIPHPLQIGCPGVFPHLRAQPFWDTSSFPWVPQLEAAYPLILQEFLNLRTKGSHFQPYRAPVKEDRGTDNKLNDVSTQMDSLGQLATDKGDWNVCYLFLHGMDCFDRNREACPETTRAIKSIPYQYNHALFSALAADTHVSEHYGPTNKKLRCHLPLVVPSINADDNDNYQPLCSLTVANEERELVAGKCVIFDDSFLHEAVNRAKAYTESDPATGPRVVLIVDIWHPDLTAEEIRFLEFLENAKMKAVKSVVKEKELTKKKDNVTTMKDESAKYQASTFFEVIEKANGADVERTNIWTA